MESMKVEITSTETIRPSTSTPPELRIFKVSLLDQCSPTKNTPLILYYPMSSEANSQEDLKQRLSTRLKEALAETLSRFYPLAGRFKDTCTIDCNDEGVLFSEAQVKNCHFSDFMKQPKTELLNQLVPCEMFPTAPLDSIVQVAIQLNTFASGGIAMGVCFYHKLVDGTTMSTFLKCWAAISRASYDEAVCPDFFTPLKRFPTRESLKGNTFWMAKQGKGVRKRFVFDSAAIHTLKAKAASQHVPAPSRVEVVSAFIWKSAIAAFRVGSQHRRQSSILCFTADLRRRMVPPLSKNCPGNMVGQGYAHHKWEESVELQGLVRGLREAVQKVNDDCVRILEADQIYDVMFKPREELEEMYPQVDLEMFMLSSWCKFGFNEVDFGLGKPIWVSLVGGVNSPLFVNQVILMETNSEGGIEAWIQLSEDVMAALENNPEFCTFASFNPSISSSLMCLT